MDFEKHFLKEHISDAEKKFSMVVVLLERVNAGMRTGDLEWVRENLSNALKGINNLIGLSKEKQGKEQLIRLANELTEIGIDPLEVLGDNHANKQN